MPSQQFTCTRFVLVALTTATMLGFPACDNAPDQAVAKTIEYGKTTCEAGFRLELIENDQCLFALNEIEWQVDLNTDYDSGRYFCGLNCYCRSYGQPKKCDRFPVNENNVSRNPCGQTGGASVGITSVEGEDFQKHKDVLMLDLTEPKRPERPERTGDPEKDKELEDAYGKALEEYREKKAEADAQALATCNHRLEDEIDYLGNITAGKGQPICTDACRPYVRPREIDLEQPYYCCVPMFKSLDAEGNPQEKNADSSNSPSNAEGATQQRQRLPFSTAAAWDASYARLFSD